MPTTFGQLRDTVAAYMHRQSSVFVVNGRDMLLVAFNNAKNFAQRALDFERSRVMATVANVSLTNGGNLSTAVLFGTATPVDLKSVKQAFLDMSTSSQFPIDIMGRDAYVERLKKRFENVTNVKDAKSAEGTISTFPLGIVLFGTAFFVVPADPSALGGPTVNVHFDAVKWLPDISTIPLNGVSSSSPTGQLIAGASLFITDGVRIGDVVTNTSTGSSAVVVGVVSETILQLSASIFSTPGDLFTISLVDVTQTNFLLDYCFDFLVARTMFELNYFLKEDQRVPISDKFLDEIWENVMKWNETIVGNATVDNALR